MARYMADEKESTFWIDVVKIALGVFIGGLLAALAYTKIIALSVEYAARETAAVMEKQLKAMADKDRQQAEAQRLQREAQERARAEEVRQQAAVQQEQLARNARKEAAFKRYYQPSRLCELDPLTVPCINAGMVARRQFDAQYKD